MPAATTISRIAICIDLTPIDTTVVAIRSPLETDRYTLAVQANTARARDATRSAVRRVRRQVNTYTGTNDAIGFIARDSWLAEGQASRAHAFVPERRQVDAASLAGGARISALGTVLVRAKLYLAALLERSFAISKSAIAFQRARPSKAPVF